MTIDPSLRYVVAGADYGIVLQFSFTDDEKHDLVNFLSAL